MQEAGNVCGRYLSKLIRVVREAKVEELLGEPPTINDGAFAQSPLTTQIIFVGTVQFETRGFFGQQSWRFPRHASFREKAHKAFKHDLP